MINLNSADASERLTDVTQDGVEHATVSITKQTIFPTTEQTILSFNQTHLFRDPANFTQSATGGLQYPLWAAIFIIIICAAIMAGTVVGNLLVCAAVSIVRKLRTPSNWLIVSLALADLFVALLVMPLAVMYEVNGEWTLGQTVCDMWTSLDVMLCTASILNLCMISVDRYFVISRPFAYAVKRTPAMMSAMILFVWVLSAIITIPPIIFSWKSESENEIENHCELSQDIGYQIYATIGAFYLPLIVMIIIYYRIYTLSARIHRAEARSKPSISSLDHTVHRKLSAPSAGRKSSMDNAHSFSGQNRLEVFSGGRQLSEPFGNTHSRHNSVDTAPLKSAARRNLSFLHRSGFQRVSVSKERKATKTLGIIMGAFTACWLPFFIVALIRPFLQSKAIIPHWFFSLLQWLGYANSFFNPIIYARFNRDFRTPFKEILSCHCSDINLRIRSESYTEQFGVAMDGGGGGAGGGHGAGGGGGGLPGGQRGTVVGGRQAASRKVNGPENVVFVADGLNSEGRSKCLAKNTMCHSSASFRRQSRA